MSVEDDFRIRIGRPRDRGLGGRTFVGQALRAAVKAGYARRGRIALGRAGGRGRAAAPGAALRSPGRRVLVKARVVRHRGLNFRAASLEAHLRYLKRDGVDRSGGAGRLFDARGEADGKAFAARCQPDRHHFRFIASPEDAAQLADLQAFARDLMARAETDLGTRLDWVAIDHWNTEHPHLHILVRGVDERGRDLVIDRDYIARGLRARAEALVALELGPRSAREIAAGLQRDTAAERWTSLDRMIEGAVRAGRLDLRPGAGAPDAEVRSLLLGRAAALERLGLAQAEGPGVWRIDPRLRLALDALAERTDIIARLHRTFRTARALEDLAPDGERAAAPIVGRLADRGLHDELSGRAYLIVDGADGRAHHVRVRDLEAAGDTPLGGIVEVRPGGQVVHRSDLGLEAQVAADGATWLDRQLVTREPLWRADRGFGREVQAALDARRRQLVARGLMAAGRLAPDLVARLRDGELAAAGARISRETGLRFEAAGGEEVRGRYARRVDLASGRFAMVEDGLGFRLVPWARVLDRRLGMEVRGSLVPGGVSWELGRGRSR